MQKNVGQEDPKVFLQNHSENPHEESVPCCELLWS